MDTANKLLNISDALVSISSFIYLLTMILYIFYALFKNNYIGKIATFTGITGVLLHISSFAIRWVEFYKFMNVSILSAVPITNLYESLMFFSMILVIVYIIIEYKTKVKLIGIFAYGIAGFILLLINVLDASYQLNPLVPALQSNWLLAHVSLSFVAYMCFTVSAFSALLYLILTVNSKKKISYILYTFLLALISSSIISAFIYSFIKFYDMVFVYTIMFIILFVFFYIYGLNIKNIFSNMQINLDILETIIYKFIVIGFVLFTIGGLVFGAIWAETAWGNFWSWDPKETMSFITWLVYGVYLHGRLSLKWSKEMAASIAVIGFIVCMFTFLGVNLFLSGLHSYGQQ